MAKSVPFIFFLNHPLIRLYDIYTVEMVDN